MQCLERQERQDRLNAALSDPRQSRRRLAINRDSGSGEDEENEEAIELSSDSDAEGSWYRSEKGGGSRSEGRRSRAHKTWTPTSPAILSAEAAARATQLIREMSSSACRTAATEGATAATEETAAAARATQLIREMSSSACRAPQRPDMQSAAADAQQVAHSESERDAPAHTLWGGQVATASGVECVATGNLTNTAPVRHAAPQKPAAPAARVLELAQAESLLADVDDLLRQLASLNHTEPPQLESHGATQTCGNTSASASTRTSSGMDAIKVAIVQFIGWLPSFGCLPR